MTSKKTKVILAAVISALFFTESGANYILMREMAEKNTESKALEAKINTLTKQQQENKLKNEELLDNIKKNEENVKKAQETLNKNNELSQQNEELKKMNDMLKNYREATGQSLSRGGSFQSEKKLSIKKITVELSMYCATGNRTASGVYPEWGMIAAPKEIPMGTGMIFEGYFNNKVFKVTDRGGYIKKVGNVYRLDIYTDKPESYAIGFGRKRNVTAYVITEE